MGGDAPVKDTPLGVAERILDRGITAHTIEVQSEGEESSPDRVRLSLAALRLPSIRTVCGLEPCALLDSSSKALRS
jgi:hypothetical protein